MLDARPSRPGTRLRALRAAGLPVEALMLGQTVEEAAALLPRLFSACRAAQGAAARLAFGLPPEPDMDAALTREARRDHLLKIFVSWPGHYGFPPDPLPGDWTAGGPRLAEALFGAPRTMPATPADFADFLRGGGVLARILARIDGSFAPGEADSGPLPALTARTAFDAGPLENSVAARHALHPVMQAIAAARGHGPLWRAAARGFDVAAGIAGTLPRPRVPEPGRAIVPAARGAYAISARAAGGRVTSFARITPTDHLLAPGGILDRSLASLPPVKSGLAPLLLDILDPCTPVRLTEANDA